MVGEVVVLALVAIALLVATTPTRRTEPGGRLAVSAVAVLCGLAVFWVGVDSMRAAWFAPFDTRVHGTGDEVALTFDGGPNDTSTLAIARTLDEYHTQGTFFLLGEAASAHPEIAHSLSDDGQLVSNNSYRDDRLGWLDGGTSGLDRTQQVLAQQLGVCPAFFRPPHGHKTPWMSWRAHSRGMTMVLGDVTPRRRRHDDPAGVGGEGAGRARTVARSSCSTTAARQIWRPIARWWSRPFRSSSTVCAAPSASCAPRRVARRASHPSALRVQRRAAQLVDRSVSAARGTGPVDLVQRVSRRFVAARGRPPARARTPSRLPPDGPGARARWCRSSVVARPDPHDVDTAVAQEPRIALHVAEARSFILSGNISESSRPPARTNWYIATLASPPRNSR